MANVITLVNIGRQSIKEEWNMPLIYIIIGFIIFFLIIFVVDKCCCCG